MREAMRIPYIFDFFTSKPRNIQQPFNESKDTLSSIVDNWPACSQKMLVMEEGWPSVNIEFNK